MTAITPTEKQSLTAHEAVITLGMKTFVQVGEALEAIRDARLYRESHDTFEAYCKERWGFSRVQAHRLIEASETVTALPIGNKITTESQARELAKVEPDRRQEVIERATEATGGRLTAKAIKEASRPPAEVLEIVDEAEPEPPRKIIRTTPEGKLSELAHQAANILRNISLPSKRKDVGKVEIIIGKIKLLDDESKPAPNLEPLSKMKVAWTAATPKMRKEFLAWVELQNSYTCT